MELLSLADKAVVGAVLYGGAIGGDIESAVGFMEAPSEVAVRGQFHLNFNAPRHRIMDPHSIIDLLRKDFWVSLVCPLFRNFRR